MDLHTHTSPDSGATVSFSAEDYVRWVMDAGVDVVGVTDHNTIEHLAPVVAAADPSNLVVVPGIEIDTDRGDVLALAPGPEWETTLQELVDRLGVGDPGKVAFERLLEVWRQQDEAGSSRLERVILIAAHADQQGSMLGSGQTLSPRRQVLDASELDAIEVVDADKAREWAISGAKQQGDVFIPVIRGSDSHFPSEYLPRNTWMYLPQVNAQDLRHAFATPECSLDFSDVRPEGPTLAILSVAFDGGSTLGRHSIYPIGARH